MTDAHSVGRAVAWLRTVDWLWMVIGGFYQLAYSFWYLPALRELPRSLADPPERFPPHWPLDLASTLVSGAALLVLGFRRATALSRGDADGRPGEG